MFILLSPSKTQDFTTPLSRTLTVTQPHFIKEIQQLTTTLKKFNSTDIAELMSLSDKLSNLNHQRFQDFSDIFNSANSRQALFAFKGDVYTDIDVTNYSDSDLEFAKKHLFILSGLYGLLKSSDLIQPYRLEMKTKLKTKEASNLYKFWNTKVTDYLNSEATKSNTKFIINLASEEYFKVLQPANLQAQLINVDFKQLKNGTYKIVPIYAKKARGTLANYIIKNKLTNPLELKQFNLDNYYYNPKLSSDNNFIFTRDK